MAVNPQMTRIPALSCQKIVDVLDKGPFLCKFKHKEFHPVSVIEQDAHKPNYVVVASRRSKQVQGLVSYCCQLSKMFL